MREHRPASDVAGGPDARSTRGESLVHLDNPFVRYRDADGIETEVIGIRLAAGGKEEMRRFDRLLFAADRERRSHACRGFAESLGAVTEHEANAFAFEYALQRIGDVAIFVLGDLLRRVDDGHFRTHPAIELAHLQPDVPRADDQQVLR